MDVESVDLIEPPPFLFYSLFANGVGGLVCRCKSARRLRDYGAVRLPSVEPATKQRVSFLFSGMFRDTAGRHAVFFVTSAVDVNERKCERQTRQARSIFFFTSAVDVDVNVKRGGFAAGGSC